MDQINIAPPRPPNPHSLGPILICRAIRILSLNDPVLLFPLCAPERGGVIISFLLDLRRRKVRGVKSYLVQQP